MDVFSFSLHSCSAFYLLMEKSQKLNKDKKNDPVMFLVGGQEQIIASTSTSAASYS